MGLLRSCWAFATTGVLEAQYAKKTGNLISFSEQQLLDCSSVRPYQNKGCNGGLMEYTYTFTNFKGVMKSDDYPVTLDY